MELQKIKSLCEQAETLGYNAPYLTRLGFPTPMIGDDKELVGGASVMGEIMALREWLEKRYRVCIIPFLMGKDYVWVMLELNNEGVGVVTSMWTLWLEKESWSDKHETYWDALCQGLEVSMKYVDYVVKKVNADRQTLRKV